MNWNRNAFSPYPPDLVQSIYSGPGILLGHDTEADTASAFRQLTINQVEETGPQTNEGTQAGSPAVLRAAPWLGTPEGRCALQALVLWSENQERHPLHKEDYGEARKRQCM